MRVATLCRSLHLVCWSAFFFISNTLFGLIFLFIVSTRCSGSCCLFVIEIWISSALLILGQKVLWKTFFCFLGREHGFQLSDSFSHFWLVGSVIEQSAAEKAAILLQNGYREVAVLVSSVGRPAESSLEREAIYQVEFAPHHHSSRAFTSLLNDEVAAIKAKVFRVLTE